MAKERSMRKAICSLLICWFFYLYSYVTRVEPSVLVNQLQSEFGITTSVIGLVISIAYIPYVAMQIPCGILTDKLGIKNMLLASCVLSSIGTFVFGAAETTFQLGIGRFMIGLAAASAFLCCGKVASEYFAKERYAMLMGFAMFMGCLGGIFGTAPIAYFSDMIGWRMTTYVISFIGLILAVAVILTIEKTKKHEVEQNSLLKGLKILIKNPNAWLIGFYGSMTYLPLSALAELWSVPFVEKRYGISTELAAISPIVIFIGFGLGGIVAAWIAKKINSFRNTIMAFTCLVILTFAIAIYNESVSFWIMMALFFIGGVGAGANTLCFSMAYDLVPREFSGTSSGFTNAVIMSSGILFQPLLGKLLDYYRNGLTAADGSPIYTVAAYRGAFAFVIVALVLALVVTILIRDKQNTDNV